MKNKKRTLFKNKFTNEFILLLGLILIALSIYFFSDKTFHPSYVTTIPIIGTCIIILVF